MLTPLVARNWAGEHPGLSPGFRGGSLSGGSGLACRLSARRGRCPSPSERGSVERLRRERRRVRRRQRVGRERRRRSLRHLARGPVLGRWPHAREEAACRHRGHPAQERLPPGEGGRTHDPERAHTLADRHRRKPQHPEERQRPGDRRSGVQPAGEDVPGDNGDDRGAGGTAVSPDPEYALLRMKLWSARASQLTLTQSVPLDHQPSARGSARCSTRRAAGRPNLVDRGQLLHPGLDVDRASYNSSGAPCLVTQCSRSTELERAVLTLQLTFTWIQVRAEIAGAPTSCSPATSSRLEHHCPAG